MFFDPLHFLVLNLDPFILSQGCLWLLFMIISTVEILFSLNFKEGRNGGYVNCYFFIFWTFSCAWDVVVKVLLSMFCFLTRCNLSQRFNMMNVSFKSTWFQICVLCWHHIWEKAEKDETMCFVLLLIRKRLLGWQPSVKGHYVNRIFMLAWKCFKLLKLLYTLTICFT